jgi:hypothetical protein
MITRPRSRTVAGLVAGTLLIALGVTAAEAAWSSFGSGSGGAPAGSIGAAAAPVAIVAGDTVTLSWTAVELGGSGLTTDRATLVGYRQVGEDEEGPFDLDASCTDTAATTCTHTQPEGETWRYVVIAGLASWTGPEGSASVPVTVTRRPISSVSFPTGGSVHAAGWDAGCAAAGAGVCGSARPDTGGAAITRIDVRVTDPAGRFLDAAGDWVASEVWRTVLDRTPAAAGEPTSYDWYLPVADSALEHDGTYTVEVRTGDAAGWEGVVGTAGSVSVDRVAPVTTSDAPSGTQLSSVTITLTATDERSGVATTEHRTSTDDGSSFTAWTAGTSVLLDTDATHTVEFRSTDVAGNVEDARSVTVTVDLSPPTVTLTAPDDGATVLSRDAVTLSATATHPRASITSMQFEWSRDGSSWTSIGAPVTEPVEGVYSVTTTSPHLPAGELQLRATATRTGGVTGASTRTIEVRPEVVSVALENNGTAGTAEAGDRVVITFTDALDPDTVCESFSSSSGTQSHSDLTLLISGGRLNILTISDAGSCVASGFGSLELGSGGTRYVGQSRSFSGSTIEWDPDTRQLRITLGVPDGAVRTGVAEHDTTYTPGALTSGGVGLPAGSVIETTPQLF